MSWITRGVVMVVVIAVTGCPPQQPYGQGQPSGQPPGQPDPQPPPQPVATASGASCWDVLQCMTPCGADAPCQDACQQRGDATAQAQVNALLACSTNCSNVTSCVQANCAPMIQACRNGAAVATAPPPPTTGRLPQPHSTENLIPWLVGSWQSGTYQFLFNADNTVRRSLAVYARGTCASTIAATGPVTQEGDVLIMDLGAEDAHNCGTKVAGAGPRRVRYRIEWVENGGTALQLRLRDLDCTQGDLYCTELMVRR